MVLTSKDMSLLARDMGGALHQIADFLCWLGDSKFFVYVATHPIP